MSINKMREEMAEEFLNALMEEKLPWERGWEQNGRPRNAVTEKNYHGVNAVWLSYQQNKKEYRDPRWCTFRQAKNNGWHVKKGEKGVRIEFWSLYDTETRMKISFSEEIKLRNELGEDFYQRIKPISSFFWVFNGEQIEGIPELVIEKKEMDEELLLKTRDVLLENMKLGFREGGDCACYSPSSDRITMPQMRQFKSNYGYMSTFLHEAGHATGHKSRLNREMEGKYGTREYAREELRAEIASAFLAQELGSGEKDETHIRNHKAYIQSWIEVLKNNPQELFSAIRDAEQISDYLMDKGGWKPSREKEHHTEVLKMEQERKENLAKEHKPEKRTEKERSTEIAKTR